MLAIINFRQRFGKFDFAIVAFFAADPCFSRVLTN